jgi:hypothetical protein
LHDAQQWLPAAAAALSKSDLCGSCGSPGRHTGTLAKHAATAARVHASPTARAASAAGGGGRRHAWQQLPTLNAARKMLSDAQTGAAERVMLHARCCCDEHASAGVVAVFVGRHDRQQLPVRCGVAPGMHSGSNEYAAAHVASFAAVRCAAPQCVTVCAIKRRPPLPLLVLLPLVSPLTAAAAVAAVTVQLAAATALLLSPTSVALRKADTTLDTSPPLKATVADGDTHDCSPPARAPSTQRRAAPRRTYDWRQAIAHELPATISTPHVPSVPSVGARVSAAHAVAACALMFNCVCIGADDDGDEDGDDDGDDDGDKDGAACIDVAVSSMSVSASV